MLEVFWVGKDIISKPFQLVAKFKHMTTIYLPLILYFYQMQKTPAHKKKAAKEIINFYKKVNKLDVEQAEALSDEMYQSHPFIISIFLGYNASKEYSPAQLGEIIKILATLWLYNKGNLANKITKVKYDKFAENNFRFLAYWAGESEEEKEKTLADYYKHHANDVALLFLMACVREKKEFNNLSIEDKAKLILELKSVNDCLEQTE